MLSRICRSRFLEQCFRQEPSSLPATDVTGALAGAAHGWRVPRAVRSCPDRPVVDEGQCSFALRCWWLLWLPVCLPKAVLNACRHAAMLVDVALPGGLLPRGDQG